MKFALLGVDAEVLAVAKELVAGGEHEIVAVIEPGEFLAELRTLAPLAKLSDEWEGLLLTGVSGVVIVGRAAISAETRADQLRKLTQAVVPLVLVQPACEYIIGYELEMIRSDVRGVIIPYYPGIFDDHLRTLRDTVLDGQSTIGLSSIGRVEQLVFQRRMRERTKASVTAQLARDAEMIRQVLGDIRQMGASGSLDDARGPVNLSVQLTSQQGLLARWSVEPGGQPNDATITLLGDTGKATLELSNISPSRLTIQSQAFPSPVHHASEVDALVDRLTDAISGKNVDGPTWLDACRASEIADTVPRCLARGKTIDLYNEEHTEEGAFKGTMAVGGCLIIMLGLFVLVVVVMVEGLQLPLRNFFLWRIWPLYLLVPMVIFLMFQVLGWLANSSKRESDAR